MSLAQDKQLDAPRIFSPTAALTASHRGDMTLSTEPIGSIPRPLPLTDPIDPIEHGGRHSTSIDALYAEAIRDTVAHLQATRGPLVTDAERKRIGVHGTALGARSLGLAE